MAGGGLAKGGGLLFLRFVFCFGLRLAVWFVERLK